MPSSPQRAAVAADVGTPAMSERTPEASRSPSASSIFAAVEPLPRPEPHAGADVPVDGLRAGLGLAAPRGRSRGHRVGDRSGVGERRAAGEPLADVHRRAPVDEPLALEQRHARGARCRRRRRRPPSGESRSGRHRAGRPWPHRRAGRRRPPRAAPTGRGRPPTGAGRTRAAPGAPCRAECAGRRRRALSSSRSPWIRPSRMRTWASSELPDGVGLSSNSLCWATSCSASLAE